MLLVERFDPGTNTNVQRRSLGPKRLTKVGLHTLHHPTHTLLGHFQGRFSICNLTNFQVSVQVLVVRGGPFL